MISLMVALLLGQMEGRWIQIFKGRYIEYSLKNVHRVQYRADADFMQVVDDADGHDVQYGHVFVDCKQFTYWTLDNPEHIQIYTGTAKEEVAEYMCEFKLSNKCPKN